MELTLGEIINAYGSLQFLVNLEMNPGPSYQIGKNLKALNAELVLYYDEKTKIEERLEGDTEALETNIKVLNETKTEVAIKVVDIHALGSSQIPPVIFLTCDWMFSENGQEG